MKISIVTPSFNSSKYISETIESVLNQCGNFEIEYIIVDGLSTDGTMDIIKKYRSLLEKGLWDIKCLNVEMKVISEKDDGMYDAINKGFKLASGDVYAYLNSDDIYLHGAFETVINLFRENSKVKWIKGITSYIDESSKIFDEGKLNTYSRSWIKKGVYGRELPFIQQDSTFWRSELWDVAGPINSILKYAGDYYLWINFAKFTSLFSLKIRVSCFRKHEGQLSQQFELYRKEMNFINPCKHPYIGFFYSKFPQVFDFFNRKNIIEI